MPVSLKKVKQELQSDIGQVGKTPDGSYKFIPPNIVGRRLRDYAKLRVSKLDNRARPGTNIMTYSGLVQSESETGVRYKVSINFHDVDFREKESAQFKNSTKTKIGGKKTTLYYRPMRTTVNKVTLKCQCQDFRHRFETPLAQANGLIGAPRKYTRKTDPWPVGRPFANSTEKLGICKHINSLLLILRDKGELKER